MTSYRRGYLFELEVAKFFKKLIPCLVFRSAGSHGAGDLIVLPLGGVLHLEMDSGTFISSKGPWLIQCKRTDKWKKKEMEEFFAMPVEAVKVWAWRKKGERKIHFKDLP